MAKVRVYELAKELGVDSRRVMATLARFGEFVRSASSTVEPPVVRKLRQVMRDESTQAAGSARPVYSEVVGEAARIFGVSPEDPRLVARRPTTSRGHIGAAKTHVPTTMIPVATDTYGLDWAKRMVPPDVRQAFVAAGLDRRSAAIVEQCQMYGITPHDLGLRVDGVRVAARLRGGESVESVVLRMREAHIGSQAAR